MKERELELQEELQTLKKKNEQEIADEKQKNEHLPRAGNRVSELKDMLHQRVEEIAALKKQNQEMKGLSSTQRFLLAHHACSLVLLSHTQFSRAHAHTSVLFPFFSQKIYYSQRMARADSCVTQVADEFSGNQAAGS